MIHRCLETLCQQIGPRPAGSEGYHRSERFIASVLSDCGFKVEIQRTACPRWELKSISLRLDGRKMEAMANPYAPSCNLSAPLVCVQNLEDLRQARVDGRIVVLSGELTASGFSPKNFDVYRDDDQDEIIHILESRKPRAVLTVSKLDSPVPLIEDADFPLPSATVPRQVGIELDTRKGQTAELSIISDRKPGFASNIIARGPGVSEKKLVAGAHFDTKFYSPGATDNASGVAVLLNLACLLRAGNDQSGIELVAFGGEDSWYPAETGYVTRNEAYFPAISTMINVDGVGVKGCRDSIAFLACPDDLVEDVLRVKILFPEIVRVEPWYEGDHSLFWPRGIPSIAVSSAGIHDLSEQIQHTPMDTLQYVDEDRIEQLAHFLLEVIRLPSARRVSSRCPLT